MCPLIQASIGLICRFEICIFAFGGPLAGPCGALILPSLPLSTPDDSSQQTIFSDQFIYSDSPLVDAQRDVIKTIIREKIQKPGEEPLYHFAVVKGPFWNDKWGTGNTCEFYDCDSIGAQVISYDRRTGLYPIINLKDLFQFNDKYFIVSVQAGDRSAEKDDLMGIFIIGKSTLESGNRIIYRQKNSRGGIDFMIELQTQELHLSGAGGE